MALLMLTLACDDSPCDPPDCGPGQPPTSQQPPGPPYDPDGDSISTATEQHPPNAFHHFRPDTVDVDPSRSRGTPTSGSLDSAINLVDFGTMYFHFFNDDPAQTDDWAILRLLNVIEGTGRRFNIEYGFSGSCRAFTYWSSSPRIQIGDLSQQNGGQFILNGVVQHQSHQNGLDVDVRYLRDDIEAPMNFTIHADSIRFDRFRTIDMMRCFLADERVELILYDSVHTGILGGTYGERVRHAQDHHDHFHVRIRQ